MKLAPLKHGPWKLTDLTDVPQNGLTVFSCFHGGGGSTMGYKLAGYDVLGGVEIDPEMMAIYRANHKPKHSYLMGVQQFKKIPDADLPPELFNLDILDGSPPCSSFSMAGSREKKWGKAGKFREGQATQVLDDLFFDFIDIAKKLKPKVVVAENVKGLITGKARGYVKEIFAALRDAGYTTQLFLLNAASMGVPQRRERTFFIASYGGDLKLSFQEEMITVSHAINGAPALGCEKLSPCYEKFYEATPPGGSCADVNGTGSGFQSHRLHPGKPAPTMWAQAWHVFHPNEKRTLGAVELCRLQTFPDDYSFPSVRSRDAGFITGMSVPPFMMQRVAREIHRQWFGGTDA